MNSTQRMMSRFAAAAGIAAALWMVSPAAAAEADAAGKQTAGVVGTKTASAPAKRHVWPRYRLASWYASHTHYADAATSLRHCTWFCGRPFVLMVGVAY